MHPLGQYIVISELQRRRRRRNRRAAHSSLDIQTVHTFQTYIFFFPAHTSCRPSRSREHLVLRRTVAFTYTRNSLTFIPILNPLQAAAFNLIAAHLINDSNQLILITELTPLFKLRERTRTQRSYFIP